MAWIRDKGRIRPVTTVCIVGDKKIIHESSIALSIAGNKSGKHEGLTEEDWVCARKDALYSSTL